MLGYINGTIIKKTASSCIVVVQGLGYEVEISTRTAEHIHLEQTIELFIYTHVREDQFRLFGFEDYSERELFSLLNAISGIGPKAALSILNIYKPEQIKAAITKADVNFFSKIKGLGKKRAQKIIIELKSKMGSLAELNLQEEDQPLSDEVSQVLLSLGFAKKEIEGMIGKLDTAQSSELQIKQALQLLGKTR